MKNPLLIILIIISFNFSPITYSQQMSEGGVVILHDSLIKGRFNELDLTSLRGWKFSPDDGLNHSSSNYDDSSWKTIHKPLNETENLPEAWNGFGWFRLKVKMDSSFSITNSLISAVNSGGLEFYINDSLILKQGNPSPLRSQEKLFGSTLTLGKAFVLEKGKTYQLAIKYSFHDHHLLKNFSNSTSPWEFAVGAISTSALPNVIPAIQGFAVVFASSSILLFLVMVLHLVLYQRKKDEEGNFWVFLLSLVLLISTLLATIAMTYSLPNFWVNSIRGILTNLAIFSAVGLIPLVAHKVLDVKPNIFWKYFTTYPLIVLVVSFLMPDFYIGSNYSLYLSMISLFLAIGGGIVAVRKARKKERRDLYVIAVPILAFPVILVIGTVIFEAFKIQSLTLELIMIFVVVNIIPLGFSVYQAKRFFRMHRHLDELVSQRTKALETAYSNLETSLQDLKVAQNQLVQQEKLASLGQLTAGIAHEIKNPLNFVTNFSDVCLELIEEAREELSVAKRAEIPVSHHENNSCLLENMEEIFKTMELNLKKILQHGSRADGIVKSMLLHSRGGSGSMEPTELNHLVKEYVNLAYHGMRASRNPLDVKIDLDLDEKLGTVPLVTEDFSRVILNLCNNAFDAMKERSGEPTYKAILKVSTEKRENEIAISIKDNGTGIDPEILDHIMQPFYTTKKGTDGTGLGLSLSHEVVKAHGGQIKIETIKGTGTTFIVILPGIIKK